MTRLAVPFDHQCAFAHLPVPVAEYCFARETEGRRWRVDWCFVQQRIALEVEGGYAQPDRPGRHTRTRGFLNDMEKYNSLACHGFRLLRVTPRQMADGRALMWVERILKPEAAVIQ